MKKIMMLFVLLALSLSVFSCGGGGAGSADTPSGENPGIPSVVKLSPSHFIAQTNSFIFLHTQVLDGNGSPVSGVTVRFTNLSDPFGKITSAILRTLHLHKPVGILSTTEARTNGLGIATVKITSPSSGFATIQAEVNKGAGLVRDRKTVFFTTVIGPVTPPQPTLTLHVDDGDGTPDQSDDFTLFKTANDNQRTITAVVLNGDGTPVSGATVTFGADSTEATFPLGNVKTTDNTGQAQVLLQVNPATIRNIQTVLNITAQATWTTNGTSMEAANMVSLFLLPVTVTEVTVSANPSVVSLNGTSTILASVILNTGGQAPDGSTVNFTTTCGAVTPFAQTTGGVATATFTAPSIPPAGNICTVTATIGGQSGTANITVTTSLTVQPGAQTINGVTGGTVVFTIFGGTPGYTVTSNNPAVAFNTTPGNGIWDVAASGGTFTVTVPPNAAAQSVTLTIRDQIGTTVNATLTIGGATSLSVQPNAQTIDGSAGGDATFTIFGGVPGYTVFANTANPQLQPDPPNVAATGGAFTIHVPASTPATTVVYTIRDSLGATTTATLTITAAAGNLLILPGSVTAIGATGDSVSFTVSGGTAPYVITSTDPANAFNTTAGNGIWNVSTSGSTFDVTVPAGAPNETVTLNVFDSVGNKTSATVTITGGGAAGATLAVSPASVSVTGMSDASDQITFVITGGTSPFSMVSDNSAVVPNVAVSGRSFTINPNVVAASTGVNLTVIDSLGATTTAAVTVTPATSSMAINPSTIAVTTGTSISFNIIGGKSPYSVYSSNTGIVALGDNPYVIPPGTNPFTATTPGTGTATITVVDSDGQTVTSNVTVTGPPIPNFTITCDPSVTVPTAATRTFSCSLTSLNSFSNPVTLTCPDLPAGSTCTGFNPASPVTPAANVITSIIVTINNASTATGSYPFHVMGTSGLLSHTAPVTLTVP